MSEPIDLDALAALIAQRKRILDRWGKHSSATLTDPLRRQLSDDIASVNSDIALLAPALLAYCRALEAANERYAAIILKLGGALIGVDDEPPAGREPHR